MPIEFRCGQCNQLLRVPDDSAGKHARCPKCQALMTVPASSSLASGALGDATEPFTPQVTPLTGGSGGVPPAPPTPANPYSDATSTSPFGEGKLPNLNPYAPPSAAAMQLEPSPFESLPITPHAVAADVVFNYAWEIWKTNLGLLVGATLVLAAVGYAIGIPFSGLQIFLDQRGDKEAAIAAYALGQIINNLAQ